MSHFFKQRRAVDSRSIGGVLNAPVMVPELSPDVMALKPFLSFNGDDTLNYALSNWYGYVEDPDNADSLLSYQVASGGKKDVADEISHFVTLS